MHHAVVAIARGRFLGHESEVRRDSGAGIANLEFVAAVVAFAQTAGVVLEKELSLSHARLGRKHPRGTGDLASFENLAQRATDALVVVPHTSVELGQPELRRAPVYRYAGIVAGVSGVADGPRDGVPVFEFARLGIFAARLAKERSKEREVSPAHRLEVGVEVPPSERRRRMRQVVDRQIDRTGTRPVSRKRPGEN